MLYKNYHKAKYIINNIIPIFYHIPKCGGTSLHFNIILNNLYKQYVPNITDKIYNINIIKPNTDIPLYTFICYEKSIKPLKDISLENIKQIDPLRNLYDANILLNNNTFNYLKNNYNILSIIIQPEGFCFSLDDIKYMIPDNKTYESYILLREPLSWHKSLFYYLRDFGKWEYTHVFFNKDISFSDYINSSKISDSWLIRNIRNLKDTDIIMEEDYKFCIDWLNSFTYVGFLEKFDNLIQILNIKYDWENSDKIENKNTLSIHEEISSKNMIIFQYRTIYDYKLYNYFYEKNLPLNQ